MDRSGHNSDRICTQEPNPNPSGCRGLGTDIDFNTSCHRSNPAPARAQDLGKMGIWATWAFLKSRYPSTCTCAAGVAQMTSSTYCLGLLHMS